MAGALLELIWYNLISLEPFTMSIRVSVTAEAVRTFPWPMVILIAATFSSIGILPLYYAVRFKVAHPWERQVEQHRTIARLRARLGGHMFLWQIVLNAIPLVDWGGAILAGCERYPMRRLFPALVIGRCIHNAPIALSGLLLVEQPWFRWWMRLLHHPIVIGIVCLVALSFVITTLVAIRRIATPQATP